MLQVYITAIKGHVPDEMMSCIVAFLEVCYLARQDEISASDLDISVSDLDLIKSELSRFYHLRQIFIATGVRSSLSLPWQHALFHYLDSILPFGSPNGLCSSITEEKHIEGAMAMIKSEQPSSSNGQDCHSNGEVGCDQGCILEIGHVAW